MSKTQLLNGGAVIRADADEDEKKDDADAGTLLKTAIADMTKLADACETMMDSVAKRMDAMEGKVADACARMDAAKPDAADEKDEKDEKSDASDEKDEKDEKKDDGEAGERGEGEAKEVAADKRKDGDEKDEKDEKHADADMVALRAEIADLKRLVPRPMTDTDADAILQVQADADQVFTELGMRAPGPLLNEEPMTYRRRLLKELKQFSPSLKDANLYAINDSQAFSAIEKQIYADALGHARSPASVPAGRMRSVTRRGDSGHTITEHFGESASWMGPMAGAVTSHVTEWGDRG